MKINSVHFKEKLSFFKVFIFLSSLIVVGFGQPAWSSLLGMVSASTGFAFFWWVLKDFSNNKIKFLIALFWFFGVQLIQLSWMNATEYQGQYIYIVYLLLALALGGQFAWFTLYVPNSKQMGSLSKVLALAGFWTLLEWLRLFFMSGFPFNPIGMSLSSTLVGRQLASVTGVYGMSFWVILTNLLTLRAFLSDQKKRWRLCVLFALCPYLYGALHLVYHTSKIKHSDHLHALLVQTALSPEEKTGIKGYEYMMPPLMQWKAIFSYLAPYQHQKQDLIILPERSVPFADSTKLYPIEKVHETIERIFGAHALEALPKSNEDIVDNLYLSQFLANYFNAEVLVGLEYLEDLDHENYKAFASAFCFHPHRSYEVYHKRILLPIVEYLPFQWCRDLAKRYHIYGWYEKGDQPGIFQGKVPLSPSICIEELYGSLLRKNRLLGAELFVNLTNDVWFPNSKLPRQHFEHGLIRCLENGIPAARSCNTGVTAVIDAVGRVHSLFGGVSKEYQWQKGALSTSIPIYHYKPLFLIYGNTLIVCLSMVFIVYFFFEKRRQEIATTAG